MTLLLATPLDSSDPLLLSTLKGIAAHLQDDTYFQEKWQQVRLAVRLREPHLTAQIDRLNEAVDERFDAPDWDAMVEAA